MANSMDLMAAELQAEQNAQAGPEGQPSMDSLAADLLAEQNAVPAEVAPEGAAPAEFQGFGGAPAPVDPDSISSTVGRSVDNLQAAYGGAGEMIGEIVGSEGLQQWGKGVRDEQQAQAAEYGEPTVPTSIKDVDDLGDLGGYLKDMGLKSLAPMATIGAGTTAGAAAGARMAPGGVVGKAIGGFVGGMLGAFGMEAGELQNAIKAADPEAKSPWSAFAGGTVNAALDAGGASYLLRPFIATMGKEAVVKGLVKQGLTREAALAATKAGALEGGIGSVQALIGDTAVAAGTGQELSDDVGWHMLDGLIGGSLLGSTIGGTAKAIDVNAQNQKVAGSQYKTPQEKLAEAQAIPVPDQTDADLKTISKLETQIAKEEKAGAAPQSLLGKAWSTFGGSSVDKIQGLAEVSPTAKEFSEAFRPDMSGKTASKPTLFEDADLMAGKWRADTKDVLVRNKSEEQLSKLFDEVSQPKDKLTSPDAIALRKVLDDVHDTAVDGGLDAIGYVEGHLPVRLDRDLIIAKRPQFVQELVMAGRDRMDAENAVDQYLQQTDPKIEQDLFPQVKRSVTVDEVTGSPVISEAARADKDNPDSMKYRMGQGSRAPEFGHLEKTRAFSDLSQATLNHFAKEQTGKQKAQAVKDYFEGAAHRIAAVKRFGPNNDLANGMVAKAIVEAQSKGRKVEKQEVDRMYDVIDAYNGLHGRVKDARLRQIQSTAGAVITVATLPLAALSSLTEMVVPAIRGDVQAAVASAAPAMAQMARDFTNVLFKGANRTEFAQIAAEANITFEAATSVAAERLGANMLSRGASTLTKNFFIINGLSLITHMTRTYAAKTGDYIFKRNLRELANGLPLDSAQGRNRLYQLRSMGVDVTSNTHALSLYSPIGTAQNKAARDARIQAVKRFTDQSVLDPNLGSTPLWMNEGRFQTVAMLKRYPSAFGNTILPQLARRFSREYAGSYTRSAQGAVGSAYLLGMMIGIGYIQDELKQWLKGSEDTRTEAQRFTDVVSQSAMNMQGSLVLDTLYNSPRYGQIPLASVMGPFWGSVGDGLTATSKTITSFADDPTSGYAVKYLLKLTPARSFQFAKDIVEEM